MTNTATDNTNDSNPTLRAAAFAMLEAARISCRDELATGAVWIASALEDSFVETCTIIEAMHALSAYIAAEMSEAMKASANECPQVYYTTLDSTHRAIDALALLRVEMIRRDRERTEGMAAMLRARAASADTATAPETAKVER
jgi:hypothetical protein